MCDIVCDNLCIHWSLNSPNIFFNLFMFWFPFFEKKTLVIVYQNKIEKKLHIIFWGI